MPRHSQIQNALSGQLFNAVDMFKQSLETTPPWDSIIDFATHKSFCGQKLYPKQRTLLKLIYLETENMTAYDLHVINMWREGFLKHDEVCGVQPDIWQRVKWLKERGYRHFPHIQMVIGRRGSKGVTGGIIGTERMAYFWWLDNWQRKFGVKPHSNGYLSVIATTIDQAKMFQFKDIQLVVRACEYLQPHISSDKPYYMSLRTPTDLAYAAELHRKKIPVEDEIASIKMQAFSANSASSRGGAMFATFLDEFAHQITGTGSSKTGEEIYTASQPALRQFKRHKMTYIPSTPFCLAPETRVLTQDLKWVTVGSVCVGDTLIGFDEEHKGLGRGRTWQPAVVTETNTFRTHRYKITMESGKELISTEKHLWLWRRSQLDWKWRETGKLKPGDKIHSLGVDPWEEDQSREAGYLAGFYDGEGCLATPGMQLAVFQNDGPVIDQVREYLKERHFETSVYKDKEYGRGSDTYLTGGYPEVMRFLGEIRPQRLLVKFPERFYGSRLYGNKKSSPQYDVVVSVEPYDIGEVVALGTSTQTLVAEGLLSHNSQIGQFFELYNRGSVLLNEDGTISRKTETDLQVDSDEIMATKIITANPTMLIAQFPSWELYEDYDISHTLPVRTPAFEKPYFRRFGPKFDEAIVESPEIDEELALEERINKSKFRVEYRGQFAPVEDAYLAEEKIKAMYDPLEWRPNLEPQVQGILSRKYMIHCDPGKSGANFAMCVAHLEDAPPIMERITDIETGVQTEVQRVYQHVIVDYLKVWRPQDYPDGVVDYIKVKDDLDQVLTRYQSTEEMSFDQWNSSLFIAQLKQKFAPTIRILEKTFDERKNQDRFERFKSALNLGWVHAYRDNFYKDDTNCLLELELKFLQEVNGKVVKQEVGPVTTKDLADCLMVVTVDLLHDQHDKWWKEHITKGVHGSTDVAGLRHGRELERFEVTIGSNKSNMSKARQTLLDQKEDRARGVYRNPASFPTRGRRF